MDVLTYHLKLDLKLDRFSSENGGCWSSRYEHLGQSLKDDLVYDRKEESAFRLSPLVLKQVFGNVLTKEINMFFCLIE